MTNIITDAMDKPKTLENSRKDNYYNLLRFHLYFFVLKQRTKIKCIQKNFQEIS